MTNEEFLAEKFCMSKYFLREDLLDDKAKYLVQQMNWLEEHVPDIEPHVSSSQVRIVLYDEDTLSFQGSCLLEAIESAQEEMNNV